MGHLFVPRQDPAHSFQDGPASKGNVRKTMSPKGTVMKRRHGMPTAAMP